MNDGDIGAEATHGGPPLPLLAIVYFLLFAAGLIANILMTGDPAGQNPYNSIDVSQAYYTRGTDGIRLNGFFVFASMIPLGLFTAAVFSRLLFHGVRAVGVYIALFGGFAAALFLGVSGIGIWALSQPGVAADVGGFRVAQLISFGAGGFGHVAAMGLLIIGVSMAGLTTGLIPKWICWLGLIVGSVCEIAALSMIFPSISVALPIARFASFIWLIAVGFALPNRKR